MKKQAFLNRLLRYLKNKDEVNKIYRKSMDVNENFYNNIRDPKLRGKQKGYDYLTDRNNNLRDMQSAGDLAAQRHLIAGLLGGGAAGIGGSELADYLSDKEAAYLGGFMDKCAEYGLSQEEAEGLAKEAFTAGRLFRSAGNQFKNMFGPSKSMTDATMGAGQAVAGMLPGGGMMSTAGKAVGQAAKGMPGNPAGGFSRLAKAMGKGLNQAAKYSPGAQAARRMAPAIGGAVSTIAPTAGKMMNQAGRFSPALQFGKKLFGR